ncbi:hypothetical protein B0T10DRAFT_549926 [Thelonectria olida]|uniref:Peptidase S8/S53 domain-containing protein n=1 Tax=Thelonectria olida TaxID=1576542 RepID=A0A9P9ANL8_9HYPO|nr:hypothetical protein B0T10DRAFT_549926 [Thelonectria olida]
MRTGTPPDFQRRVNASHLENIRKDTCIVSFAVESIELVEKIIQAVKADKNHKIPSHAANFCRTLTGLLSLAKSGIQDQQQTDNKPSNTVADLLDQLEWICSYQSDKSSSRNKTVANRWPTLKNLRTAEQRDAACNCLRKFSSKSSFTSRKDILEQLKHGLPAQNPHVEASPPPPERDITSPVARSRILDEDIRDETETLLGVLRAYRSCNRTGSLGNITAKIRISGCARTPNSSAEFGILFLGHPHAQNCRWKEACIRISTGKSCARRSDLPIGGKPKGVRFVGDVQTQSSLDLPQLIPITRNEFCDRVSKRDQAQLSLSAQDGQFVFQKKLDTSREWLPDHQAISLRDLIGIEKSGITPKMKTVLAHLLAKAVWQFYDSEILGKRLTKNEVYFLFERRGTVRGIYTDEPMVKTHVWTEPTDSRHGEDEGTHDMPKVLALGIMLLELETNKFIEEYRDDLDPGSVLDADTDYKIAKRLVDSEESCNVLDDLPKISPLRTVLPLCINAGELQNRFDILASAQKQTFTPVWISRSDGLRATIFTEIVKPLEDSLTLYTNLQNIKALRKLAFDPTSPRPNRQGMVALAEQIHPQRSTLQTSTRDSMDKSKELRELSRGWFRDFDRLKQFLCPQGAERGPGYRQVKIAVLDTGINADDYEYYSDIEVIGGYRDFVDRANCETRQDKTGHGSIAASLLVKVCPDGILYIARVLEGENAIEKEVQNVVDAIEWAISEKVDIITMAIGFDEHQTAIEQAVRKARLSGILIFSAASNKRNASEIYCPANIHDCVFGVFVANSQNTKATDFNPTMSLDSRRDNFAIFGEHVEWQESQPLVRGASYATSIAAGLVALLLQFSRQAQDGDRFIDLTSLKDMTRMATVLRMISKKDGSCDCICPLRLLKDEYKVRDWDLVHRAKMRKNQRDWIRAKIEQALDSVYKPN